MPRITKDNQTVTQVTFIEVEPEKQPEALSLMTERAHFMARQPGFISISLHRSLDGRRIVNYLQWQNRELLQAAHKSPEFRKAWRKFDDLDRKSTRLNSSHLVTSYAVFCVKKKNRRAPLEWRRCGSSTPLAERESLARELRATHRAAPVGRGARRDTAAHQTPWGPGESAPRPRHHHARDIG